MGKYKERVFQGRIESLNNPGGNIKNTESIISMNIPDNSWVSRFPGIEFHARDQNGYWGRCAIQWLNDQFGDSFKEGQRFTATVSDRSVSYRLIPSRKLTKEDYRRIDARLNYLLPEDTLQRVPEI